MNTQLSERWDRVVTGSQHSFLLRKLPSPKQLEKIKNEIYLSQKTENIIY